MITSKWLIVQSSILVIIGSMNVFLARPVATCCESTFHCYQLAACFQQDHLNYNGTMYRRLFMRLCNKIGQLHRYYALEWLIAYLSWHCGSLTSRDGRPSTAAWAHKGFLALILSSSRCSTWHFRHCVSEFQWILLFLKVYTTFGKFESNTSIYHENTNRSLSCL